VIVYDVTNESSFQCMDKLKKLIEKHREKKEVILIALWWINSVPVLEDQGRVNFSAMHEQEGMIQLFAAAKCPF